ncbi:MAG: hypothetical protein KGO83_04260, partial [Paenibacillaceae bacterium]|nr:hypothetical protein [Paenibacillaceae bacterium]
NDARFAVLPDGGVKERDMIYNGNGNLINYANRPLGWHMGNASGDRTNSRLVVTNGVMEFTDTRDNGWMFTDATVKPNKKYVLSGLIGCEGCKSQIDVHFIKDKTSTRTIFDLLDDAQHNDLRSFEVRNMTIPEGVTRVRIFFVKKAGGGTLRLDNVSWRQEGVAIEERIAVDPSYELKNYNAEDEVISVGNGIPLLWSNGRPKHWSEWKSQTAEYGACTTTDVLIDDHVLWAMEGKRSINIETRSSVDTSGNVHVHAACYQDVKVLPNKTYLLRGMLNCHRCIGFLEAELFSHETDDTKRIGVGASVATTNHELPYDGTEKYYSVVFKTPANAKRARIHIIKHDSKPDANNYKAVKLLDYLFADDIALQEVTDLPLGAIDSDALGGQKKFASNTAYVPLIDIVAKDGYTLNKSNPFTWDGDHFEVGPSHTNYYSDALFADDISLKKWGNPAELVKNGNAENGTNDWITRTSTGATAIHTINRDFWTISDTASLMIATPSQIKAGGDQHHGDFYQDIDVDPNQTYVLKGKINCHRCEGALYVEERTVTGGLLRSGAHVQDFPWEIIRHHWKNNNPTNFASFLNNDKAVRTINRVFVTSPSTDKVRIVIYKGNSTDYFAEGLLVAKTQAPKQTVDAQIRVPVAKIGASASAGDVIDTEAGMDVEITKWEVQDGATWNAHTGAFAIGKTYRVLLSPKRKGSSNMTTKDRTLFGLASNYFTAKDIDATNPCDACITSTYYDSGNKQIWVRFKAIVPPKVEGVSASWKTSPLYVEIKWTRAAVADRYIVYRDGNEVGNQSCSSNICSYLDTGAIPGQTHEYYVLTEVNGTKGNPNEADKVNGMRTGAPQKPTGATVVHNSPSSENRSRSCGPFGWFTCWDFYILNWYTQVSWTHDWNVDQTKRMEIEVQYGTWDNTIGIKDHQGWVLVRTVTDSSITTISGIQTDGPTFRFRIRACNDAICGPYRNTAWYARTWIGYSMNNPNAGDYSGTEQLTSEDNEDRINHNYYCEVYGNIISALQACSPPSDDTTGYGPSYDNFN